MPRKTHARARNSTWENHKNYKERKKERNHERKKAREIYFAKYPHECVICGYDKIVEVHHIIELHAFKDPVDGNGLENMVGVCPNHHGEYHRRLITREDILMAKMAMAERMGLMPKRLM